MSLSYDIYSIYLANQNIRVEPFENLSTHTQHAYQEIDKYLSKYASDLFYDDYEDIPLDRTLSYTHFTPETTETHSAETFYYQ